MGDTQKAPKIPLKQKIYFQKCCHHQNNIIVLTLYGEKKTKQDIGQTDRRLEDIEMKGKCHG